MESLTTRIEEILAAHDDERNVTRLVADALREFLTYGIDLPAAVTDPSDEGQVLYPLHVDPRGRFSIVAAMWNVGQGTPVHGHETWGVIGIHSGREGERSYEKPTEAGSPLTCNGEHVWHPGDVTVCCTTDDDIHEVWCEGEVPVVGIHVYGADIGRISRRSYDPRTGEETWFISSWWLGDEAQS